MRGVFTLIAAIACISFAATIPLAQSQLKRMPPPPAMPTPTPKPRDTAKQPGEVVNEDDVIKVSTNLVTSNALVVGRNRKYVPGLRRENFKILENGVEQEIAYFAPIDRPFDTVLLIDNSRSAVFELSQIKEAAIAFIDQMRSDDRATIIPLGGEFKDVAAPSADHQLLKQAIYGIQPGGNTRVYDAVDFAINQTPASATRRKALLLLTDGVDNDSRSASYQTNLNDIVSSGVQVYAVQFSTYSWMSKKAARFRRPAPEGTGFAQVDYQRADAYLHQVTELTGTSVYPAENLRNLDTAVAAIAEELHNEYTVGYYPRVPGKVGEVRRLEIRVNQPWLQVRARTSYSFGGATAVAETNRPVPAALSGAESVAVLHDRLEQTRPLNARWVCKGPFVPGDFALVQEGYDSKCPPSARANDSTNAWFIRKPEPSEIVCKGFLHWNGADVQIAPIPAGYVVTGETKSTICSPSNDGARPANAWKIKRPTKEETICKGFVIPRGFVVANETIEAACPSTPRPKNAWIIIPKPYIEQRQVWQVP